MEISFMEYPKINSLWKRDMDSNKKFHKLIEGDYACPEFATQKKWRVQEKIDGTNVRIYASGKDCAFPIITYKGRTSNAQLHPKLLDALKAIDFTPFFAEFPDKPAVFFGEGFGAGIQTGGIYRPTISFILFDVYISGRWSTREEVSHFAEMLHLETPHDFGLMTEDEIVSFVKSKPRGRYRQVPLSNGSDICLAYVEKDNTKDIVFTDSDYILEGVIARSEPLVRFNTIHANPVVWKLKVRDFK